MPLDPLGAEGWLGGIEQLFEVLKCSDEEKVYYTSFMLYGDVRNWWKIEKKRLDTNVAHIT